MALAVARSGLLDALLVVMTEDRRRGRMSWRILVGTDNSVESTVTVQRLGGRRARRRQFGIVAASVVRTAMVPVLVVPTSSGTAGLVV